MFRLRKLVKANLKDTLIETTLDCGEFVLQEDSTIKATHDLLTRMRHIYVWKRFLVTFANWLKERYKDELIEIDSDLYKEETKILIFSLPEYGDLYFKRYGELEQCLVKYDFDEIVNYITILETGKPIKKKYVGRNPYLGDFDEY